jgi:signal transduction histidine kinase
MPSSEATEGSEPPPSPERIDWSQFWYPGPRRVFTAAELAQAGGQRLSPTLVAGVLFNYALLALLLLTQAPPVVTAALTALLVVVAVAGMAGLRALWRRPTRRALALWTFGATTLLVAGSVLLSDGLQAGRGSPLRAWILMTGLVLALLLTVGWWMAVMYRAHAIESHLRELAERQRALDMARQLAAAQIRPHFLFNSLASLQHWVHTKDDRAAPLLDALAGFLRATLPLFNRERLALAEEALAAHEYLTVMGLRLGERLRWTVQIDPTVQAEPLPPGLLMTLVENAVEHGVQVSLGGASVAVSAWREEGGDAAGGGRAGGGEGLASPVHSGSRSASGAGAARVVLQVHDSGPGPAPGWADGVGLANSRVRLAQAFGPAAQLSLSAAAGGGCLARITWPAAGPPPGAAATPDHPAPTSPGAPPA